MTSESDIDVDAELRRGGLLAANGRFKKADAIYQRVLVREPNNARARAAKLNNDAALGRISYEEALPQIREIIVANPDNDRIPSSLINVLARMGRMDEYALERNQYFARFPDSPAALQMQANGLQVDLATKDNPDTPAIAWSYYQKALKSGPLLTPCFREVAYRAARRADPTNADSALDGASPVERLTIRTRVWGPQRMALLYLAGLPPEALLWRSNLTASIAVQSLMFTWGLWAIYCNSQLCCKRCRDAWIVIVSFFTMVDVAFDHLGTWYIPVGIFLILFAWMSMTGKLKALSNSSTRSRADAQRSARGALAGGLIGLTIVDAVFLGQIANHHVAKPDSIWWTMIITTIVLAAIVIGKYRRSIERSRKP